MESSSSLQNLDFQTLTNFAKTKHQIESNQCPIQFCIWIRFSHKSKIYQVSFEHFKHVQLSVVKPVRRDWQATHARSLTLPCRAEVVGMAWRVKICRA